MKKYCKILVAMLTAFALSSAFATPAYANKKKDSNTNSDMKEAEDALKQIGEVFDDVNKFFKKMDKELKDLDKKVTALILNSPFSGGPNIAMVHGIAKPGALTFKGKDFEYKPAVVKIDARCKSSGYRVAQIGAKKMPPTKSEAKGVGVAVPAGKNPVKAMQDWIKQNQKLCNKAPNKHKLSLPLPVTQFVKCRKVKGPRWSKSLKWVTVKATPFPMHVPVQCDGASGGSTCNTNKLAKERKLLIKRNVDVARAMKKVIHCDKKRISAEKHYFEARHHRIVKAVDAKDANKVASLAKKLSGPPKIAAKLADRSKAKGCKAGAKALRNAAKKLPWAPKVIKAELKKCK